MKKVQILLMIMALLFSLAASAEDKKSGENETVKAYASIGSLKMYYETHGAGAPLVLIHGGLCTIEACFGKLIPPLAKTRRVIAMELQAHGHTADVDRPLTYPQLANDVVALLGQLGVGQADFLGYSIGSGVALEITMRHPGLVRKLVLAGGGIK